MIFATFSRKCESKHFRAGGTTVLTGNLNVSRGGLPEKGEVEQIEHLEGLDSLLLALHLGLIQLQKLK